LIGFGKIIPKNNEKLFLKEGEKRKAGLSDA